MADGTIIIDTKINADGMQAGAKEIENSCKRAAGSVNRIGKSAANAFSGGKYETPEFLQVNKDIDKVMSQLTALDAKKDKFLATGGSEYSKQWKSLEYDADRLVQQYDRLLAKKKQLLENGGAFTTENPNPSPETPATSVFKEFKATAVQGLFIIRLVKTISQIINAIKQKIKEIEERLKKVITVSAKAFITILKPVGAIIKGLTQTIALAVKGMFKSFGGIAGIFGKIASFLGGAFLKAVKYAFDFIKSNSELSFKTMANQISEVNADLSTLVTAINQVKASIATMLQPLLTVVVPTFQKAIQAITAGMNTLGEFFAELTGQGYIYEATAEQIDYAESLTDTAKAAKKATSNLSGLDQIHKWQTENQNSKDDTNSNLIPKVSYKKKEVSKPIKDFADAIKKAWEDADFTSVGKTISNKLATALKNINWAKIKANTAKVGKSLATFMNGAFTNMDFSATLGKSIGESVNTIVTGIKSFVNNADFKSIGTFVGDLFNNGFATVGWKELGSTIGQAIGGAAELVEGFLLETDFLAVGKSIGETFKSAFDNIPWETLGNDIGNSVNGAVDIINGFFDTTKYAETGANLANVISQTFKAIKWENLGKTIGRALNSASSLLIGFFNQFDVNTIKQSISDLIYNAFDETNWLQLGYSIGTGVRKVIDLFLGLIEALWNNKDQIMNSIAELITGAFKGMEWETLGTDIGNGINKLFELITGLLDTLKKEHVSDKIRTIMSDAIRTVDWGAVGRTVADAVNTLLEMIPYGDLLTAISDFVSGLLANVEWEQIAYALFTAKQGITDGIIKGIYRAIGATAQENFPKTTSANNFSTIPNAAKGNTVPPNYPVYSFNSSNVNGGSKQVSGGSPINYTFTATLDGKQVFKSVVSEAEAKKRSNGVNPLLLGGK